MQTPYTCTILLLYSGARLSSGILGFLFQEKKFTRSLFYLVLMGRLLKVTRSALVDFMADIQA